MTVGGAGRTTGREDLRVVVRYRRPVVTGLHVVLGALDAEPPPGRWSVVFADRAEELAPAVAAGLAEAERVLVLWSFYSGDVPAVAEEIAACRSTVDDPRVVHLAGGVHASAEPAATAALGFDVVAVGEGESIVVGVATAMVSGGGFGEIAGLTWLEDGGLVTTGPAERHPLDRWPAFAARWGRFNAVEITRGCIYACRFCQTPYLFKARFRHRSVADVRAHVAVMRREGLRYVRFVTPTALSYGTQTEEPDLEAVEALLAGVREELGPDGRIYFGGFPSELRPEHVTPEALAIIRRWTDTTSVIIGAQSGDEGVLAGAKRGHGVDEVERAVRVAIAAGFRPDVDFLFGLPGEGGAEAARSMAFAQRLSELGARIHAHTFLPLPGTPWRGAAPGSLDDATRSGLARLAGSGAAHGQWRSQEELAQRLVPLVRRGERRRDHA
jgi:B12-binding domain/radical SAM domain protein